MTLRDTSQDQEDLHKRPSETAENWYTLTLHGWKSTDKSKKSDSKQIVAFMKLFLPNGYVLDKNADIYKDQVKQVGDQAAANLVAYLRENSISSSGSSAILKHSESFTTAEPSMSISARQTAIKSFTKFLAAEDVTLDAAQQLIDTDKTERPNWLLEVYPHQGGIVKPLLQNMLSRLGKYCNNREEGLEKKVPPCSKQDLETIVRLLYTSDNAETCFVDATLVVTMWYLYGRSSDAEQLEKQQLSILPGKNLWLNIVLFLI
ncbi:Hypothetical protein PHPALM_6375 [Phytophthora palmivora]|uniref:Uncharacterized protein n=1 Tax=Phytophthora palmivora TaxID=4796 RepID=A0A2P4YEY8_9STRA|nr:Hypothetical protein PHPALM_6375 [Phytophthora palmivora]